MTFKVKCNILLYLKILKACIVNILQENTSTVSYILMHTVFLSMGECQSLLCLLGDN